jgi:hypothetical protein
MPGTTVPGLGTHFRRWRERMGMTRLECATTLVQGGFSGWGEPASLVWAIGVMEDNDEWPFDDGLTAASDFFLAARKHMTQDALYAEAFRELAELLYRPLLAAVHVVMLAPDAPHR